MEVLQGDRFKGLCALTAPPPVEELRGIAQFLAMKIGREVIAMMRHVCVRIAIDQAGAVLVAIPPSMKRRMDCGEQNAMWALWEFLFEGYKDHRTEVRRIWSHLVDSGPIGDPKQIFLELAFFEEQIVPLLETTRKLEGFSTLNIEGRDTLDAVTLARVFMAYVADNCDKRNLRIKTRIVSVGLTLKCQAKLHVLLHNALSDTLSIEMALAAILYDPDQLFSYREFTPAEKLTLITSDIGCTYDDLFIDPEKKVDWDFIHFGMPQNT